MKLAASIPLALMIGLFISCSSGEHLQHAEDPISHHSPSPNTVTSIAGVIAKNAQGHSVVGDVVLYFSNSSIIKIDGVGCSKGDLQTGMTIEAEGNLVNGNEFHCTSLATNSLLRGNIDSINIADNTLVVGETMVVVGEKTNMAGFCAGDAVKVFGNFMEGERILASCLLKNETAFDNTTYTAQGAMSGHNAANKTFQCGRYTVDYSNAQVEGTPVNGCQMTASGLVVNGVMQADRLHCYGYNPNNQGTTGGYGCMAYGSISNWDPDNNQFQLGSGYGCCAICYWVNYDEWTPGVEYIATGAKLNVEGTLTTSGGKRVVKASKITR